MKDRVIPGALQNLEEKQVLTDTMATNLFKSFPKNSLDYYATLVFAIKRGMYAAVKWICTNEPSHSRFSTSKASVDVDLIDSVGFSPVHRAIAYEDHPEAKHHEDDKFIVGSAYARREILDFITTKTRTFAPLQRKLIAQLFNNKYYLANNRFTPEYSGKVYFPELANLISVYKTFMETNIYEIWIAKFYENNPTVLQELSKILQTQNITFNNVDLTKLMIESIYIAFTINTYPRETLLQYEPSSKKLFNWQLQTNVLDEGFKSVFCKFYKKNENRDVFGNATLQALLPADNITEIRPSIKFLIDTGLELNEKTLKLINPRGYTFKYLSTDNKIKCLMASNHPYEYLQYQETLLNVTEDKIQAVQKQAFDATLAYLDSNSFKEIYFLLVYKSDDFDITSIEVAINSFLNNFPTRKDLNVSENDYTFTILSNTSLTQKTKYINQITQHIVQNNELSKNQLNEILALFSDDNRRNILSKLVNSSNSMSGFVFEKLTENDWEHENIMQAFDAVVSLELKYQTYTLLSTMNVALSAKFIARALQQHPELFTWIDVFIVFKNIPIADLFVSVGESLAEILVKLIKTHKDNPPKSLFSFVLEVMRCYQLDLDIFKEINLIPLIKFIAKRGDIDNYNRVISCKILPDIELDTLTYLPKDLEAKSEGDNAEGRQRIAKLNRAIINVKQEIANDLKKESLDEVNIADRQSLIAYFQETIRYDFVNAYYLSKVEKPFEGEPGEQKEIVSSNRNSLFSSDNSNPLKEFFITNANALKRLYQATPSLREDKDVQAALLELAEAANTSQAILGKR